MYSNFLVILAVSSIALLLFHFYIFPEQETHFNDLKAYQSAFQAFTQGSDPYSRSTLAAVQGRNDPIMVFNPPFFFPLFAPILAFDHITAAHLLFIFSFLALFGATLLVRSIESGAKIKPSLLYLGAFTSAPAIFCLSLGQVTILLMFSLCASLFFGARGRFFLAGLFLVPLLAKPHLAYLFLLQLTLFVALKRKWSLGLGALTGIFVLSAIAELWHPHIHSLLFFSDRFPTETSGSGIPSLFRAALVEHYGTAPTWPLFAVPLFTAALLLTLHVLRKPKLEWPLRYDLLIPLSLITAPYGFFFDQALLIPSLTALLLSTKEKTRTQQIRLLGFLLLISCVSIATYKVEIWGVPLGWNLYLVGFLVAVALSCRDRDTQYRDVAG